jgi:pilus assembly protein CpaF
MLQAMNTGPRRLADDGATATRRATRSSRIETMIAMGATNLPERAMRPSRIRRPRFHLVVQQTRLSDGVAQSPSVSEITGMEGDVITMQEIYVFEKTGRDPGRQSDRTVPRNGVRPKLCERLKTSGIHLAADMFDGVMEIR